MSSSQDFLTSSQISPGKSGRRKSRFTYKHLAQLGLSSAVCPLRVIAHVDLDAFYAQCEGVRLGIAEDQPLAVQVQIISNDLAAEKANSDKKQWQGLIAINYPARKFGLNRHVNIVEAKKLCPDLIMQHVATWKEGDEKWAYHEDAFKHIATHKVSLDPYRRESRRILACIKDVLPPTPMQRVEKASVDEVFLDLSAQVHSMMLEKFPEISGPAPYDDATELLPRPPTTALDWNTDALVDLDHTQSEEDDPDWDDIAMLLASDIVRFVRGEIRRQLKYTCSAGIAHNKMLAKLGSGHRKPNQQTVIRNRAVQHFLSGFKFTKIRNLGGKLGDEVVTQFATDEVSGLLPIPIDQLKSKLGDDTGSWIYHLIRGEDSSEVNARTQIKSMLSAKSFRPTINSSEQAVRWLRIFVADIMSRLIEDGVIENKRRPKTINLHHRQGAQTRSRQAPIPTGRPIDENLLFDIAKNLLGQAIVDGRAWPCSNLSLSVGGFEEGPTGNRGIGSFLVRGEEAKAITNNLRDASRYVSSEEILQPIKRRKVEGGNIQNFFAPPDLPQEDSGDYTDPSDQRDSRQESPSPMQPNTARHPLSDTVDVTDDQNTASAIAGEQNLEASSARRGDHMTQSTIPTFFCTKCHSSLPETQREEHEDWHFAKDLQAQEHPISQPTSSRNHSSNQMTSDQSSAHHKKVGKSKSGAQPLQKHLEKGQKKLAFG